MPSTTSRCKITDVNGKKTSGGTKTISDVSKASSNTLTAYEIQKSLDRWHRETCIISKIIQFENDLGRPLNILDLFCKFDRVELDCVRDMLRWLVVDGIPYHDAEGAAREEMPT